MAAEVSNGQDFMTGLKTCFMSLRYLNLAGSSRIRGLRVSMPGAEICREEDIDVILAVGGGSTIDCSKAIAAAAYYEGDAWDLILHPDQD